MSFATAHAIYALTAVSEPGADSNFVATVCFQTFQARSANIMRIWAEVLPKPRALSLRYEFHIRFLEPQSTAYLPMFQFHGPGVNEIRVIACGDIDDDD